MLKSLWSIEWQRSSLAPKLNLQADRMQIQNCPWECQLFSEKQGKERMVYSLRRLFATDQIIILMILYSVGPTSTKITKIEYNAVTQKEHNAISES